MLQNMTQNNDIILKYASNNSIITNMKNMPQNNDILTCYKL
jgi:hypothetical protein